MKPYFESEIYTRAVDLKQRPCLCGDLFSQRIVFTLRPLKAAILLAYEALRALLSRYDCGSVSQRELELGFGDCLYVSRAQFYRRLPSASRYTEPRQSLKIHAIANFAIEPH